MALSVSVFFIQILCHYTEIITSSTYCCIPNSQSLMHITCCLYSNIVLCCSNVSYIVANLHEVYSNIYHWGLWPSSYIINTVCTYIHGPVPQQLVDQALSAMCINCRIQLRLSTPCPHSSTPTFPLSIMFFTSFFSALEVTLSSLTLVSRTATTLSATTPPKMAPSLPPNLPTVTPPTLWSPSNLAPLTGLRCGLWGREREQTDRGNYTTDGLGTYFSQKLLANDLGFINYVGS